MTPDTPTPDTPTHSARALGYRMPAEFEAVEAVWLTFPHNPDTWPGCLEKAQAQYEPIIEHCRRFAKVHVIGRDHPWLTDDSWIRDYGPIFVTRPGAAAPLACHDFIFNCWGAKYEPYAHDDVIPQHIANLLNIPIWRHDLVLEGGSIEVNGRGVVMTTEQCLLNPNRNPHLSRTRIEHRLHEALGTSHVLWLPGGIEGDDTDGHIDDVARFIAPDTIAAIQAPRSHPDHDMLERNWRVLRAARDQDGKPFNLVPLPVPEPILYDYPPDPLGRTGLCPTPASYANFLIVNRAVLLPVFGQKSDDLAIQALEQAMPDHEIIPLRAEHLVVGLGAIHCLSMHQPAV